MEAHPLHVELSQQRLLHPITPAYNQNRLDGRLKLTASAFNQLWISMPTVLVTVPTVTKNSLYLLSTLLVTEVPKRKLTLPGPFIQHKTKQSVTFM